MKYRDYTTSGYRSHYDVKDLFGRRYKPNKPYKPRPRVAKTQAQCLASVAKLKISSRTEYINAWRSGSLPGCPGDPQKVYNIPWAEILGKRPRNSGWPSLTKLKGAIKKHGIGSLSEYYQAWQKGKFAGFPFEPPIAYGVSWNVIMGKPPRYSGHHKRRGKWKSLSQLKCVVKRLGITSVAQYKDTWRARKLHGFPSDPNRVYSVRWSEVIGKKPGDTNSWYTR